MKHIARHILLGVFGMLILNSASAQQREENPAGRNAASSRPASPDVIYVKGVPAVKVKNMGMRSKTLQREGLQVSPAYPNPFDKEISINYSIPRDGRVSIKILDINGQVVKVLEGNSRQGTQSVVWDGRDEKGNEAKSGVYRCLLEYNEMQKISVVMKN